MPNKPSAPAVEAAEELLRQGAKRDCVVLWLPFEESHDHSRQIAMVVQAAIDRAMLEERKETVNALLGVSTFLRSIRHWTSLQLQLDAHLTRIEDQQDKTEAVISQQQSSSTEIDSNRK